jgi:hypothetical protein
VSVIHLYDLFRFALVTLSEVISLVVYDMMTPVEVSGSNLIVHAYDASGVRSLGIHSLFCFVMMVS